MWFGGNKSKEKPFFIDQEYNSFQTTITTIEPCT
jgi:hypothetical protein